MALCGEVLHLNEGRIPRHGGGREREREGETAGERAERPRTQDNTFAGQ